MTPDSLPPPLTGTAALVVAHPSHELRVHGWMQTVRPRVLVLTDGSGRTGRPRLDATSAVLADVGADVGSAYGCMSDLDLYAALLGGNARVFIDLVERIAADLERARVDYVVRDAAEGYASAHDVGALVADAAVDLVERRTGRRLPRFDFLVVGVPKFPTAAARADEMWVDLDDVRFARKVAAARRYHPTLAAEVETALAGGPLQGVLRLSEPRLGDAVDTALVAMVTTMLAARPELEAKVREVLGGVPLESFRHEQLRIVAPHPDATAQDATADDAPPFYELYGEQLVAAGRYREVIRRREHVAPIAAALRRHVDGARACAS